MSSPESKITADLSGKTALVTGASGLGAHFAKLLARAGASVIVGACSRDALSALSEEIVGEGGECKVIALDVTSSAPAMPVRG